ncbi:MAG: hypothetical protein AB8B59_02165 [Maribacter sp.]
MKRELPTLAAFLLLALMLFKVSSFHVYSHEDSPSDDIENCNVCELAVENQNTDYLFATSQIVKTPHSNLYFFDKPVSYKLVVSSSFLRFNFFGRPPPNMS